MVETQGVAVQGSERQWRRKERQWKAVRGSGDATPEMDDFISGDSLRSKCRLPPMAMAPNRQHRVDSPAAGGSCPPRLAAWFLFPGAMAHAWCAEQR